MFKKRSPPVRFLIPVAAVMLSAVFCWMSCSIGDKQAPLQLNFSITNYDLPGGPNYVSIVDLNGDGSLDLAVAI